MLDILLIRHGKASPNGEDYDVLSDKGIEQARITGSWLGAEGASFAASYVGPLRRQQETWQHLLAAAGPAASTWPAPETLAGLTEAPMVELVRRVLPLRLPHDAQLQTLVQALQASTDRQERRARFSDLYQYVVGLWCDDTLGDTDLESYAGFQQRVAQALEAIVCTPIEASRSEAPACVAVVSSMGAIAELLKQALGWDRARMWRESEEIANASLTTLRFDGARFSLARFNHVEHLAPHDLVTYI